MGRVYVEYIPPFPSGHQSLDGSKATYSPDEEELTFMYMSLYRLAMQGRKPEDKGWPFPEYACHGGGTSFDRC